MLVSLRINNLAVAADIKVEFASGLSVITGETGAGKSMLADALNLLLGSRADKSVIRTGEDRCQIQAAFELADASTVNQIMDEAGLDPCEDGLLVIRRTISASGSGRISINDTPATLQLLKQIGNCLVDLHGPHEHQSLLSSRYQLDLLDAHGHHDDLRKRCASVHQTILDIDVELDSFSTADGDTDAQIDLLDYQIEELQQINLDELDEDAIKEEHARTANAARLIELSGSIQEALLDSEQAAFNQIAVARRAFDEMADLLSEATEWQEQIESVSVQVKELASAAASLAYRIETDQEALQQLEDQIALLQKLKRKYGQSVDAMKTFRDRAIERREALAGREQRIAKLMTQRDAAQAKQDKHCSALTKQRKQTAKQLAAQIESELKDLGFPHARFTIDIQESRPGPTGADQVDFGFAPNPGEEKRSLKMIASSGEISRVMLAIKAVLAVHDQVPVLFFDEIDANLGGEMGHAVGQKLRKVAQNHQVLCITHLPQVAVCGDLHYQVKKTINSEKRTEMNIYPVNDEDRVEEIARMLGGKNLTSVILQHAQEMLDQGH